MGIEMWSHGSVSWLFKANINLLKYGIEGIYFLTFTKCLLSRCLNMWFGQGEQEKIGANMPVDLEMDQGHIL